MATSSSSSTCLTLRLSKEKNQIQINVDITNTSVFQLKHYVSSKTDIPTERMHILAKGRVLKDEQILQNIGIDENTRLFVMQTKTSETERKEIQEKTEQAKNRQKLRYAAESVAKRSGVETYHNKELPYLEITDQRGNPISLPDDQRRAVTLALLYHQRGRKYLNLSKDDEALEMLELAQKEFQKCPQRILELVDNYGVCLLDLCWLYLRRKDISQLQTARNMLRNARDSIERVHGASLEISRRSSGVDNPAEQALFVRLDILEAVNRFLSDDPVSARQLLLQAKNRISLLIVDPNRIQELELMGFSEKESRRALRVCNGNTEQAIDHIMKKREEEKAKKERQRQQERVGKTDQGQYVDLTRLEQLHSLGFDYELCVESLKVTNNDSERALDMLTQGPANELQNRVTQKNHKKLKNHISEDKISNLVHLGIDRLQAANALAATQGDVNQAAELAMAQTSIEPTFSSNDDVTETLQSNNTNHTTEHETGEENDEEDPEVTEMEEELLSHITGDTEEHLDVDFQEEQQILNEYMSQIDRYLDSLNNK